MTVIPIDKAEHCKRTLGVTESTAALCSSCVYILVYFDSKSLAFIEKIKCFLSNILFNIFF